MVVLIETREFAPEWLKNIIGEDFHAAAVLRQGFMDHSVVRDRTEDAYRMLIGFGGAFDERKEKVVMGHQLRDAGWDIVGAQLAYKFKIIWKAKGE